MITALSAGLVLGLLGSFHCIGMCGPLALAVPHVSHGKYLVFLDNLLYNGGRLITYALLGAALGLAGTSVRLAGYQDILSIVIGAIIILYILLPKKILSRLAEAGPISRLSSYFKSLFQKILNIRTRKALLAIGLMNGLLPCGLVYVALAASLSTSDALNGALFMLAFGLGTLPLMSAVYVMKKFIKPTFRQKLRRLIPVGVVIVGLMLILRGMSLGIPYVSPKLPPQLNVQSESCCH